MPDIYDIKEVRKIEAQLIAQLEEKYKVRDASVKEEALKHSKARKSGVAYQTPPELAATNLDFTRNKHHYEGNQKAREDRDRKFTVNYDIAKVDMKTAYNEGNEPKRRSAQAEIEGMRRKYAGEIWKSIEVKSQLLSGSQDKLTRDANLMAEEYSMPPMAPKGLPPATHINAFGGRTITSPDERNQARDKTKLDNQMNRANVPAKPERTAADDLRFRQSTGVKDAAPAKVTSQAEAPEQQAKPSGQHFGHLPVRPEGKAATDVRVPS